MKRFLLFVCVVIALISCTKLENAPTPIEEKMPQTQARSPFDSPRKERLIRFVNDLYTNQKAIPECKNEVQKFNPNFPGH